MMFQQRLQRIWYGGRSPGPFLRSLSVAWGGVMAMRAGLYRRGVLRPQRVGAPVIVVGNLTVGGNGKTPLVIALVEYLCAHGWQPGVVSRGYGRRGNTQVEVDVNTAVESCGDEPLLIARRTGVPVVVDADRVAAARRVVALGCDIVVADDGLQHERLHRDIEIEVFDAERRYGNGFVLPAGPLREYARPRIDLQVACYRERPLDIVRAAPGFALSGDVLHAADGRIEKLASWRGRPVHAVAGIAQPRGFFGRLREQGLDVVEHAFPDHHRFVAEDLLFNERMAIVMTDKDWVKCAGFAPPDTWRLPVQAECSQAFYRAIDGLLAKLPGSAHG